jgi:2'-hydroxyisoflavone reductase
MNRVTIYTTEPCGFCRVAKSLLDKRNVPYNEINLAKDPSGRTELVRLTGMMTFPQVVIDDTPIGGYQELVQVDRAGGLAALAGRHFDVIIDPSAYFPADVHAAAAIPADRYVLVSSASVYREPVAAGSDEQAPTHRLAGPVPEAIDSAEVYGALKVLCERAAEERLPGRALILRCGLVAGPLDPTERFVYWPRRLARGGTVLAGDPDQPVQFIDARDLATWALAAAEAGSAGVFNAVAEPLTMAALVAACAAAAGRPAETVWAGDSFLLDHGVAPWDDLPLWLPAEEAGFLALDASRARRAGLRTRPPAATVADVLRWDATRDQAERRDALTAERERALLERYSAAWSAAARRRDPPT